MCARACVQLSSPDEPLLLSFINSNCTSNECGKLMGYLCREPGLAGRVIACVTTAFGYTHIHNHLSTPIKCLTAIVTAVLDPDVDPPHRHARMEALFGPQGLPGNVCTAASVYRSHAIRSSEHVYLTARLCMLVMLVYSERNGDAQRMYPLVCVCVRACVFLCACECACAACSRGPSAQLGVSGRVRGVPRNDGFGAGHTPGVRTAVYSACCCRVVTCVLCLCV